MNQRVDRVGFLVSSLPFTLAVTACT